MQGKKRACTERETSLQTNTGRNLRNSHKPKLYSPGDRIAYITAKLGHLKLHSYGI